MYEQNNKVSGVINEDIGWLGTGAAVQNTDDSFKRPLALKQQIQSLPGQCRDRQTDRQTAKKRESYPQVAFKRGLLQYQSSGSSLSTL